MNKLVLRFLRDNSGVTAIEYALIAGGISIVILAAVQSIGTTVTGTFTGVANALQ
jgi:pilus assembly protein Flp/PilA